MAIPRPPCRPQEASCPQGVEHEGAGSAPGYICLILEFTFTCGLAGSIVMTVSELAATSAGLKATVAPSLDKAWEESRISWGSLE
jgi:hypothetical protein